MEDAAGTTDLVYDGKGRIVQEVRTVGGIVYTSAYTYDGPGRLQAVTYPSGRIVTYLPGGSAKRR